MDHLLVEIAALKTALAEREAALAERDAALAERDAEVAELNRRLAEVERVLNRNSSNSSKPPSSDKPGAKKRKKKQSGKKPGGQPGHKGKARSLVPPEHVDVVVVHPIAGACGKCGDDSVKQLAVGRRHQVFELPEIRPEVTEHQLMKGRCAGCGCRRHAGLPLDVPAGCLGPRAQAHLTTMTGVFQLSRRETERYAREVLHLDVSLGTISNTEAVVSRALAPAYREAKLAIREAPHVHADETGFQRKAQRTTTWIFSTLMLAVLCVGKDRSRRSRYRTLGRNFKGSLSTDRYAVYADIPAHRRQLCWAHILRVFVALVDEKDEETAKVGRRLLRAGQGVIHLYNSLRRGQIQRTRFDRCIRRYRHYLEQCVGRHRALPGLKTLAEAFLLTPASLWLFTTRPDVTPTNNMAERDLRPFVLRKRKTFFTQSWRGDRFIERFATAVQTCRKQARNVFDFVVSSLAGRQSLLPASDG